MKILVVGSGGREHALVWKIAQSKRVTKVYGAPGNAGIAAQAECVAIKADDIEGLLRFAKEKAIELTVVGPEAALAAGITDRFRAAGLKIFGPSREAARLEASKAFAKEVMSAKSVPTAHSATCQSVQAVLSAARRMSFPVVLKADGLAAGKGVVICDSEQSVRATAAEMIEERLFGDSGRTVVVEEFLEGEEASILVLTNGRDVVPLAASQDHKRVFDKDGGPNTGGMGAYSPAPVVTDALMEKVMTTVVGPVIDEMARRGTPYTGVLYAGIMITEQGPKVLEFNVRFGDPETQAVLPRLKGDLVEAMLWTLEPDAAPIPLSWDKRAAVCVVMASGGYPGLYEKGKVIEGLDEAAALPGVVVFHAGTKRSAEGVVTDGGRVLGVTGLGETIKKAIDTAYAAAGKIRFEKAHYRRDIGWRAVRLEGSASHAANGL